MDEGKTVTEVSTLWMLSGNDSEDGWLVLKDWNGNYIHVGDTVLHAANQGSLQFSKVVKIYQKPAKRARWRSGGGYTYEEVMDTLVRLAPVPSPLNDSRWGMTPRTINSRVNHYTFDSLTRFEVSNNG